MGSEYRKCIIQECSIKELEKQFEQILEQELYDYGHRGYTGTFAEKPGVTVNDSFNIDKDSKKSEIEQVEDFIYDNNDKWGNVTAIKLSDGKWYIGGLCST